MRFLDGLRRHLDVLEVEELALEGDSLSRKSAANDLEGLVGTPTALLGRHAEARKLFPFEGDADAELKTASRDYINRRDVFGKAYGV
jgi:hypothetical protein